MVTLVKAGGEDPRIQVAKVAKLLLIQHRLRVVVVLAMISGLLRRAAAKCGKEWRVLDFAQALVRQRTTRFRKLVRSMEEVETPPKWITNEPFEHLQGFGALDGGDAEAATLDDACSCMQAGIVNVLCQGGRRNGLWKPIIADFSVTDAEGNVKAVTGG